MTSEEVAAWFAVRERSSAARFRDAPTGPFNPMKMRDHPHLTQVGWDVRFTPGHPCVMERADGPHPGEVIGLRQTEDDGLVLDVRADGDWACTRADRQAWADSVDALVGRADERDVPILARRRGGSVPEQVTATLRTVVDSGPGSGRWISG
jgi:hypothetical protein